MKNIFTLLISLIIPFLGFTQVGIGTANPLRDLHIAGPSSTIRIDGLNATNNIDNKNPEDSKVYINSSGDLILKPLTPNLPINLVGISIPEFTVELATGTTDFTTATPTNTIKTGNFNLSSTGLVKIIFSVEVNKIYTSGNNPTATTISSDARSKVISSVMKIDGNDVSRASIFYTNETATGNNNKIVLTGVAYINLTSGFHQYDLLGGINVGTYTAIPAGSAGLKATFGGASTTANYIQIIQYN